MYAILVDVQDWKIRNDVTCTGSPLEVLWSVNVNNGYSALHTVLK